MKMFLLFLLSSTAVLTFAQDEIEVYRLWNGKKKTISKFRFTEVNIKRISNDSITQTESYDATIKSVNNDIIEIETEYHSLDKHFRKSDSSVTISHYYPSPTDVVLFKKDVSTISYQPGMFGVGMLLTGLSVAALVGAPLIGINYIQGGFNFQRYSKVMLYGSIGFVAGLTLTWSFSERRFTLTPQP